MEFNAQGNKLYSKQNVPEAIKAYSKGITTLEEELEDGGGALNEEDSKLQTVLYCNRSRAHLELCQVDEALQDAECAIDTDPQDGKGYLARAEVLLNLFDFKAALEDLDKAEELEPGLAPHSSSSESGAGSVVVCQERRRANGEWFQNCYLKKHLQLKKHFKSDYVLITEYEGEDIVEPLSFSSMILPKNTDSKMFSSLCMVGGCDGSVAGSDGFLFIVCGADGKAKRKIYADTTVDYPPSTYEGIVHAQMKREFGPNAIFKPVGYQSSKIDVPEESLYFITDSTRQLATSGLVNCFCGIESCHLVKDLTQAVRNLQPILLPGAPKWVEDKDVQEKFLPDFMKAAGIGKKKRGKVVAQAKEFRQLYCVHGTTECGKFTCHGCQKSIGLSDPQECVCGLKFCTIDCHHKSWHNKEHKSECKERLLAIPADPHMLDLTFGYWGSVMKGELPCKDEPDLVAVWTKNTASHVQDQGGAQPSPCLTGRLLNDSEAEYQFYIENERNQFKWEQQQLVRSNIYCKKHSLWVKFIHDHMRKWCWKMKTPFKSDSPARIRAKFLLCKYLLHVGHDLQRKLTCPCKDCIDVPDMGRVSADFKYHAHKNFRRGVRDEVVHFINDKTDDWSTNASLKPRECDCVEWRARTFEGLSKQ